MSLATQLLASAGTLEGITKMVNKFYCAELYSVDPKTLAITHPHRLAPESTRVCMKRGRYQFVAVKP